MTPTCLQKLISRPVFLRCWISIDPVPDRCWPRHSAATIHRSLLKNDSFTVWGLVCGSCCEINSLGHIHSVLESSEPLATTSYWGNVFIPQLLQSGFWSCWQSLVWHKAHKQLAKQQWDCKECNTNYKQRTLAFKFKLVPKCFKKHFSKGTTFTCHFA